MARDELQKAKQLLLEEEQEEASLLLERAKADAELALIFDAEKPGARQRRERSPAGGESVRRKLNDDLNLGDLHD